MQLTDKLHHLTMMLQLHPNPLPNEEPVHKTMQATTQTYATIPQTGAGLTPATLTTLHKKHS